jgi:UDP-glucose 4-epimerase
VFNIGPNDEGVTVAKIAEAVRDHVSPTAAIRYGQGSRGWTGDVPRFRYSTRRLADLGWTPKMGSEGAIRRAVEEIVDQEAGK